MANSNVKNNIVQYLVAIVVLCSVFYFMMNKVFTRVTNASNEKLEKKITELQETIDVINQKQNGLLIAIDEIEEYNAYISDAIIENTQKIDKYNKVLINIKNEYGEKIRNVDSYTTADLDSIFSGRYGKK